jgi:hypothetical protein
MLHYRRTSQFAKNLFAVAGGDRKLQAFAAGYATHLATDTAGHSYVNACAGGPYRTQWQRHHCSDNYVDVWTLAHYQGIDINGSDWYTRYPAVMDPMIRLQFVSAMQMTYGGIRHPDGRLLNQHVWPQDNDITRMWQLMREAIRLQTSAKPIPEPKPPKFPIDFDSFSHGTLEEFPYVITSRAAWNSQPPPNFRRVAKTPSYVLWERTGETPDDRHVLLEGTEAAFAVASGMAAIHTVVTALARAGDRVVSSTELYGGTYSLFSKVLPRYGIDVTFVNPHEQLMIWTP